jgi:DNA-binding transcriptional MerR regulator
MKLPEKLYYSISEVAAHAAVKPHVLRYWESEFPTLKPKKNRAGNRSYRQRDVDEVLAIKALLYDRGFKIDGARKMLRGRSGTVEQLELIQPVTTQSRHKKVAALKRDLNEILEYLREM